MNSLPASSPQLRSLPHEAVRLTGPLDARIRLCVERHLKVLDYPKLVDYFRHRSNPFAAGEFWGKTVRAACPLCQYTGNKILESILEHSVADLLTTQTSDGCISARTYPEQPKSSDLWERKYALLGLLAWFDIRRDPKVLDAMVRMADYTLGQIGPPPKTRIVDTGWAFEGIESSSILEPILRLYLLTGHQRYLDFARYIVETEGACKRGSIFAAALAGIQPKDINHNGNPKQSIAKAYESMSCFEGLLEYQRITGVRQWLDAAVAYYRGIRDQEITIIGSGGGEGPFNSGPGTGEQWNGLINDQTNPKPRLMMETCVTVTWMKFCLQILRSTGDATVVDQIERSLYNAFLGALKPSGDYWDYFQNLNGTRNTQVNFTASIGNFPLSCCTANGPMGLALIPAVAIMTSDRGPVVNLFIPGTANVPLADGNWVRLDLATRYPCDTAVVITVTVSQTCHFPIAVRIPAWSVQTTLTVNGRAVAATPGAYAIIDRLWSTGDRIDLTLDLRCRKVPAPHGPDRAGDPFFALVRGPVVLARDRRLGGDPDAPVTVRADAAGTVAAEAVAPLAGTWMQFRIPTIDGGSFDVLDYASAGNTWDQQSSFRTWLPTA